MLEGSRPKKPPGKAVDATLLVNDAFQGTFTQPACYQSIEECLADCVS